MYIQISEIPPDGLEFEKGTPLGIDLSFEGRALFPLKGVAVSWLAFSVRVSGEDVMLTGECGGEIGYDCDRCGAEVSEDVVVSFSKIFESHKRVRDGGDIELRREDLEVTLYDGKGFFLEDVIYEQMLLSLPQQLLCADTCEGLCYKCGANLNAEECSCERFEVDPRLEKLKNLREKME